MRRIQKDNNGVALVSVLVCVMLCFLLSATIMRVSYLSYLQKGIGKQTATTFYDNEEYADDIVMGVQSVAALAMSSSASTDQSQFLDSFCSIMGTSSTDVEKQLKKFINNYNSSGVTISVDNATNCITRETAGTEAVIHGVNISYTDPKTGYQSVIKTDIRVRAPFYASSKSVPLGSYSMFAGGGANVASGYPSANPNQYGNLRQKGNVYIGYMSYNEGTKVAKSCEINDYMTFILDGDNITINGDVYVNNHSNFVLTGKNIEIRGKIYLDNKNSHLVVSDSTNLICQDILVNGQSVVGKTLSKTSLNSYDCLPQEYMSGNQRKAGYENVASSLVIYNSSNKKAKDAKISEGGVTDTVNNKKAGITFDVSCLPHPNKEVGGKKYDERFLELIDIDYFGWFGESKVNNYKVPRGLYFEKQGYSVNGDKFIPSAKPASGDQDAVRKDIKIDGTTYQAEVNLGTLNEIVNAGGPNKIYFIIAYGKDLQVRMNSSDPYNGLFMSTNKVVYSQTGSETVGSSLLETDKTASQQSLKDYIDKIGRCSMVEPGYNDYTISQLKYLMINNFFVGGIKSLYEGGGSSGGGNLMVDEERNKALSMIQFENWEKR